MTRLLVSSFLALVVLTACGSDAALVGAASTSGAISEATSTVARTGAEGAALAVVPGASGATVLAGTPGAGRPSDGAVGVTGATGAPAGSAGVNPTATAASGPRRVIDLLQVPVGDGKISTSPRAGHVWRCGGGAGGPGGGASVKGPWFNADGTYNSTAKAIVDGEIRWPSSFTATRSGTSRVLSGNALPSHVTGRFPVQTSDDAYEYDRNPNSIVQQTLSVAFPADPQVASQASCVSPPFIAVLTSGAVVFDALDALNRDAGAWETQDACAGHPERTGQYHYHTLTTCIADPGTGHSALLGWAVDGFGLFGVRGERGETLTNDDLDACHGHTHEVEWDGRRVSMYHYHATHEYPYTVGCYRGTPARLPMAGGGAPPRR